MKDPKTKRSEVRTLVVIFILCLGLLVPFVAKLVLILALIPAVASFYNYSRVKAVRDLKRAKNAIQNFFK